MIAFELVELDLLATHAGVPFPFPLRVPSFGRLAYERDVLLAEAGHALCDRGLATGHGPTGVAAELVTALCEHRSAVDLVVIGNGTVTGVVAMVYGDQAMLCRQPLHAERAGTVLVTRVAATALADEFAGLIPNTSAVRALPITLPPGVVVDTPTTRRQARELVRAAGGDEAVVDQLVDLFPALTGQGQLGVTRRESGSRPLEVSWLDSPRGRVRVSGDDRGWVSVNPLRRSELVRLTRDAASLARA